MTAGPTFTWPAIPPFEEIGVRSGLAYNEDGREQAGMGVSAADIDGDGLLDIFKTNFADDTHTQFLYGDGTHFPLGRQ
jgi:enediyne biosynthesis protein E4